MSKAKNRVYNLVRDILETNPKAQNSNKVLYIELMAAVGKPLAPGAIAMIMAGPDYESVTRARRLIIEQPKYAHLKGSKTVQAFRKQKQQSKGTFAFREEVVTIIDPLNGNKQQAIVRGRNA